MKSTKVIPVNDRITLKDLLTINGWDKDKILIYLGAAKIDNNSGDLIFRKSIVKKVENYLTRIGINFKADSEKPKERLNKFFTENSQGRSLVDEVIDERKGWSKVEDPDKFIRYMRGYGD